MPEDILVHNDNWNTVSGLMEVFHATTNSNRMRGNRGRNGLIGSVPYGNDELLDDEKDSESVHAQRKHWLAVMQQSITMKELNTIIHHRNSRKTWEHTVRCVSCKASWIKTGMGKTF